MNNGEIGKGGRKLNSHLPWYKFKRRIKNLKKKNSKKILSINLEVKCRGWRAQLEKLPQGSSNFEQDRKGNQS